MRAEMRFYLGRARRVIKVRVRLRSLGIEAG